MKWEQAIYTKDEFAPRVLNVTLWLMIRFCHGGHRFCDFLGPLWLLLGQDCGVAVSPRAVRAGASPGAVATRTAGQWPASGHRAMATGTAGLVSPGATKAVAIVASPRPTGTAAVRIAGQPQSHQTADWWPTAMVPGLLEQWLGLD